MAIQAIIPPTVFTVGFCTSKNGFILWKSTKCPDFA